MDQTHDAYGEGAIDLAQSRTRLDAASDFIALLLQDLYIGPVPTGAVAQFSRQLEQLAGADELEPQRALSA